MLIRAIELYALSNDCKLYIFHRIYLIFQLLGYLNFAKPRCGHNFNSRHMSFAIFAKQQTLNKEKLNYTMLLLNVCYVEA